MPAKKPNIIEEHFEKAILGIGGLVLLYILAAYMISSPTTVLVETRQVKPGEAYKIVKEKADELQAKASQQKQKWPEISVPQTGNNTTRVKWQGLPKVSNLPAIVQRKKELKEPEIGIFEITKRYDIPKVLKPGKITIVQGRSTINLEQSEHLQKLLHTSDSQIDTSWVTVAAQINLKKQREILQELPDRLEREPIYFRVDLQRAEVGNNGKLGKWENVPVVDPEGLLLDPNDSLKLESMAKLTDLRNDLFSSPEQFESEALNPPFPEIVAGKEWTEPLLPGEKRKKPTEYKKVRVPKKTVKRRIPSRKKTPAGGMGGPGGGGGGGGAKMMGGGGRRGGVGGRRAHTTRGGRGTARGGQAGQGMMPPGMGMEMGMTGPGAMPGEIRGPAPTQQRRKITKISSEKKKTENTIKIWAHDINPKPGKTYEYRMRLVMYNPLAGYKPYLKTVKNTLLAGIESEWSDPSKPVVIEKDFYLFVKNAARDGKGARIAVYRWYMGWLCEENFDVRLGEEIGNKAETRFFRDKGDALYEERKQINFSTGAILLEVKPEEDLLIREARGKSGKFDIRTEKGTVIVFRDHEGNIITQDTGNIKGNRHYKTCKNALKDQRFKMRKMKVIRAGKERGTTE